MLGVPVLAAVAVLVAIDIGSLDSWPQLSEQDRVEAGFPRVYTGGLPLSTQPDNTSSWMRELETSGEQPNECRLLITSVVTFNQTNKEALHVVQKIYDYLRNATNHDKRIDYNIISVVQRPEGQVASLFSACPLPCIYV